MLATLSHEVVAGEGWLYERKLDGERCMAFRHGSNLRLLSRNKKALNNTYPEVVDALLKQQVSDFIIDGEIVAFDGPVTSFSRLQDRIGITNPQEALNKGVSVFYYIFDLLYLNGSDLSSIPLVDRKTMGYTWQQALAANAAAGGLVLLLGLAGYRWPRLNPRALLFEAIPRELINAIAVGVGLLIALLGFEYAGIVIPAEGTYVGLGIGQTPWRVLVTAVFGLLAFGFFWARGTVGAPLWAIISSATLGGLLGVVPVPKAITATPTMSATAFQLDPGGLMELGLKPLLVVIATFLFLDVFDSVGTLAAIAHRAGLVSSEGRMDKGVTGAFVADAAGTVGGALLGTSTISSYVESLAGIQAGARTGLSAIVVGALFLFAMFFSPLVGVIAAPQVVLVQGRALSLYPCLAPVLIGIGAMMLICVKQINWEDPTEALPAFLCIVGMPLTVSITDGIAFGFIGHVLLKFFAGRRREVNPFIAVCAALLALRYLL